MHKIANTTELQAELRRILAYAKTHKPSRKRLARRLRELSASVRGKRTAGMWDGKLVGEGCRLTWTLYGWTLEELQAKGKKKLRVAERQMPMSTWGNMNAYIAENILRSGNVTARDSYDEMKRKIDTAYEEAFKLTVERNPGAKVDHLKNMDWREQQVHYLKVVPEGTEPFRAEGKDFEFDVSWTTFRYKDSANNDSQEPSYTLYEASSAAAGRKLYQLLKAQPDALKSITKNKFSDWLTENKIGYKMHFSQWH